MTSHRIEEDLPPAPLLLAGLLVLYAGFAAVSERLPFRLPRLCPFYLITGRSCPLCGLTRALGLCLRGRFAEAFQRYPTALLTASIGLGALATHFWRRLTDQASLSKEGI